MNARGVGFDPDAAIMMGGGRNLARDAGCVGRALVALGAGLALGVASCERGPGPSGSPAPGTGHTQPRSDPAPATPTMHDEPELSVAELVRRLDGAEVAARLSAAKALLDRGAKIVPDLERLGAKGMETITPARRDVVYTLLTGLPKRAKRDVLGITFAEGVTAEAAAEIGRARGFVIAEGSRFTPGARPTCYVRIVGPATVESVMRGVMTGEGRVEGVNLDVPE